MNVLTAEQPAMLRLCLKNTFLEVVHDEELAAHRSGEAAWQQFMGSPTSIRSRSAEASPHSRTLPEVDFSSDPAEGGSASRTQLRRLSSLLGLSRRQLFEEEDAFSTYAGPGCAIDRASCVDECAPDCPAVSVGLKSPPPDTCSTADTEQSTNGTREYVHKSVPRLVNFEHKTKGQNVASDSEHPTTLMLRNVPNRFTQQELLIELELLGFAGAIDFLYMPYDRSSKASVGYAFVNFASPAFAARFAEEAQGIRLGSVGEASGDGCSITGISRNRRGRELVVSVAHLQGLEANLEHYERSAARSKKIALCRPLVLCGGPPLVH